MNKNLLYKINIFTKLAKNSSFDSLIFQHQSANFHKTLVPQSYESIAKSRDSEEYMTSRKETEENYHKLFKTKQNKSFTYATILGFNEMEDPLTFPGYTYFFKLTKPQIENTIFEVVDKKYNLKPTLGAKGLKLALEFWISNIGKFREYHDDVVGGIIRPRVEVIIPYNIKYFDYVTQIEDR